MDLEFEWSGEFTWDPQKDEQNRQKHGLSLDDGIVLFASEANIIELPDDRHDEPRFVRIGRAGRRLLVIIWTQDGHNIRLISVREATKHEREEWYVRILQGY
ncbi:MAG TPA: BrnT family toxin [Thermomicrobiales bacterium]|nr:BrnT family toxin [Thermomicrobiales bacterium]